MTLNERIRRGEPAIAAAKAQGRNVAEWEAHLEKLKREAKLQQLCKTVLPESEPEEVNQILDIGAGCMGSILRARAAGIAVCRKT
jgi:hypothetical protein